MGCDDMPRNGSYVIGAIARTGAPLAALIDGNRGAAGHAHD
jgi:hypothetical protein